MAPENILVIGIENPIEACHNVESQRAFKEKCFRVGSSYEEERFQDSIDRDRVILLIRLETTVGHGHPWVRDRLDALNLSTRGT
jgi:hypothetical protein